ncbi:hypothetical protein [Lacticaseibacillus hegangensis]|uniref:Uncharacterized protein n=1 Tax=Lacticaseibacillus hegangensis TaxID=2486010 RepID=A0ABW4CVR0_9LACO|nr:hypothetical protein [Lacticaseibacillus hegangensis]
MKTLSTYSWLVWTLVVLDALLIFLAIWTLIVGDQGIALFLIQGATILVIATGALARRRE